MTLSIICPTYNEERYIAQTLESFISQKHTLFDLEVLICDGRSTDRTRDIVTQYSNTFPNIRLIDNPDRKTPFAFNAGLRAATGEYIAILGAHTKYDANYLQVCYDELVASKSVGCTGRVITKAAYNNFEAKLAEWVMLSSFGVSTSSFRAMREGYVHSVNFPVFRKQALLDLGGYDTKLERNQDNDMNQRLLDAGHKLYCTWKTKCYYRPPADLKNLFKYGYRSGFWNAKSVMLYSRSMRPHHLIPFFFASGIILSSIGGLVEKIFFKTNYLWSLLGIVVSLHLVAGILYAVRSLKYENDGRKIVLPFIFFAFHFSYGWGTLRGFLKGKKY
ncbi:MAG: succinoglycan biosynthesis protein exoA [Segetibacter sp.]|jgi:glycosyltransferase involved in cell wall biosynthesis|nr:succinoglycan biosynthesis protein exoA [Segetibacter sp.]